MFCFMLILILSDSVFANTTLSTSYTTVIQRSYYMSKDTPSSIAAAVLAGVSVLLLALLLYQTRQTSRQLQFLTSLQQQPHQPLLHRQRSDEEEHEHFSSNPLVLSTDDKDSSVALKNMTQKNQQGTRMMG